MLALCGLAGGARANLIYDFNIGAAGPIHAFSFSFTVPSFVGVGQSPPFTPFTVTDGTHTWTMINDLTGLTGGVPSGCFMFDNGGSSNFNPPCGVDVLIPPDGAFYLITPFMPLPTATGAYSLSGAGLFDYPGSSTLVTSPSGTLDITSTSTPEPASIGLLSVAVGILAWGLRKRLIV
jgi:hypothetical protein